MSEYRADIPQTRCIPCDEEFDNTYQHGTHVGHQHGSMRNYYETYLNPKCKVCGDDIPFDRKHWRRKTDNRPENLELWIRTHPEGIRASDLNCPHCGENYV